MPEADPQPPRDALTIGRMLLLTAGLAIGLGVFSPPMNATLFGDVNGILFFYNGVLLGLALPAPIILVGQRLRKGPAAGPGGLLALTLGLGVLLMLPPALAVRLGSSGGEATIICLFYVMPLVSAWYLLATILAGQLRRSLFRRSTPWTERYGFFLAAGWTPLGVWWLLRFYWDAFT